MSFFVCWMRVPMSSMSSTDGSTSRTSNELDDEEDRAGEKEEEEEGETFADVLFACCNFANICACSHKTHNMR